MEKKAAKDFYKKKKKMEPNMFKERKLSWVLTPDEFLWLRFYFNITQTDFLRVYGYSQIKLMRLYCFKKAFELFELADTLEKSFPGFVNRVLQDFEKLVFMTDRTVIASILKNLDNFTFQMWRMCLTIGDYSMQHSVFVLTCYLMHMSTLERAKLETLQLRVFGKVFPEHLLSCVPCQSGARIQMEQSRKFLNLLNMSRLYTSHVLSISALELTWGDKTFIQSSLYKQVWIDFNFYNPYVSVWCSHADEDKSEVNIVFRVKTLSMGRYSSCLILVAYLPVKIQIFGGTQEMLGFEDVFTFKLTTSGFLLAQFCSEKLRTIQLSESAIAE